MAKGLPYYPYYVNDFDEDPNVLAMNLAEVGLYQLALNESWKRGSIPSDPEALALLIRRRSAEVVTAWPKVGQCWVESCVYPGKLVNPRQEREREKAALKSENASRAARGCPAERSVRSIERSNVDQANARIRASESKSISSPLTQTTSTENTPMPARGPRLSFEEFLQRWNRHRGFKKPNKAMTLRSSGKFAGCDLDEEEMALALDGYHASEWGRKEGWPIMGFLKNPASWVGSGVEPEADLPEIPAKWNQIVSSAPANWDPEHSPLSDLKYCLSDPVFVDRHEEAMKVAQRVRVAQNGEANWLNLEWFLRKGKGGTRGWWRVLTDLNYMTVKSGKLDPGEEYLRKHREAEEAAEKEWGIRP